MAAMNDATRQENEQFENDVLRIARALWPSAAYSGSMEIDGQERDGVFETDECIHLVEATTSRRKDKAEKDIAKLTKLAQKLQKKVSAKAVKCWFVTRDEPTADQRKVSEKHRPLLNALSFSQFQSRLIDSMSYLSTRDNYYFGSVRNPATGSGEPSVDFIEVMLSGANGAEVVSPKELVGQLNEAARFVILGDYGAGKSMTLRYLYQKLSSLHRSGKSTRFPVFINLRDHYGQSDPSEVIERHARNIGYPSPIHLVRAWRAGYVHLLLDGFDEITTLNIQGLWTKLRDNRYRAMEAVRRLAKEHPDSAGCVIAGRAHFFDSEKERRNALGLPVGFREYSLTEFNDDQIREFFVKSGLTGVVPTWLPARPLLVAYLAAKGLLSEVLANEIADPAYGWNLLLDNVASRESEIEAGIDGGSVRRILERLASKARATAGGLGPITPDMLVSAFCEVCGYNPDERGMVLLQRLPGLGTDREDESTRAFIDEDFADACRAGDLVHFVESPYQFEENAIRGVECSAGSVGVSVAVIRAKELKFTEGKVNAAIQRARDIYSGAFTSDLARVGLDAGFAITGATHIEGVHVSELELTVDMGDAHLLEFRDCFFGRVCIDHDVTESSLPRFISCFIDEVDGRLSKRDLPAESFYEDCIVESFSEVAATTNAVLSLSIPLGTRVVITILKKLYQRSGAGRKENALFRGLDHHARRLVPDALELIRQHGLAMPNRRGDTTVWLPDRSQLRRAGRLIAAPNEGNDPLLIASADLE